MGHLSTDQFRASFWGRAERDAEEPRLERQCAYVYSSRGRCLRPRWRADRYCWSHRQSLRGRDA